MSDENVHVPPDLTEVSTEDLFNEIARRNKATLLLSVDERAEEDKVLERMTHYMDGGTWTCIGMAEQFAFTRKRSYSLGGDNRADDDGG